MADKKTHSYENYNRSQKNRNNGFDRFLSFVKKFIKAKKIFGFPKKSENYILDYTGSQKIIKLLFSNKLIPIIESNHKEIYLGIIILIPYYIIKKRNLNNIYLYSLIKFTKAKFVFSFIDTSYNLTKVFKELSDTKIIFFLNGRYTLKNRFLDAQKTKEKYSLDYYFVSSNSAKIFFENYIEGNIIVSGSLVNNSFIKPKITNIKKVQWISQFREYGKWNKILLEDDKFIIKILEQFCLKKNIDLEILLVTKSPLEKIYFNNFSSNLKFVESNAFSYDNVSSDAIIAGSDSNFTYECFGRGFKTAFFTIRSKILNDDCRKFNWPLCNDDSGDFWCNNHDESKILDIMNFLYEISSKKWEKIVNQNNKDIMLYDYGNSIILKTLKKSGFNL